MDFVQTNFAVRVSAGGWPRAQLSVASDAALKGPLNSSLSAPGTSPAGSTSTDSGHSNRLRTTKSESPMSFLS